MNTLSGKVIDHITGLPIPNARLMLLNEAGNSLDIAQITSDNGVFNWSSLLKGSYLLQVFCDGYQNQYLPVNFDNDELFTITVALHKV